MLNKTPKFNNLKNVPHCEQSQNYNSKIVISLQLKNKPTNLSSCEHICERKKKTLYAS